MKRRLFNAAAMVSLVLCVIVAGLWVRSFLVEDLFLANRAVTYASTPGQERFRGGGVGFENAVVASTRGIVVIAWENRGPRKAMSSWLVRYSPQPPNRSARAGIDGSIAGFFFRRGPDSAVQVPYWAMAFAAAVVPMIWFRSCLRRRRNRRAGIVCPS